MKSLPFHIPEAWNWDTPGHFRAEPPRIGHYREYPPGIPRKNALRANTYNSEHHLVEFGLKFIVNDMLIQSWLKIISLFQE